MIKFKIGQVRYNGLLLPGYLVLRFQNIALFLVDDPQPMEPSKPATGAVDSLGNLRLPPFPPRKPNEMNPHEIPKTRMNQDEANEMQNTIFRQLHEFEECVGRRYPDRSLTTVIQQPAVYHPAGVRALCISKATLQIHWQISPCSGEITSCHIDLGCIPCGTTPKRVLDRYIPSWFITIHTHNPDVFAYSVLAR